MHQYSGQKVKLIEEQFSFINDRFVLAGTEGTVVGQYSETIEIEGQQYPRMLAVRFEGFEAALQIPVQVLQL